MLENQNIEWKESWRDEYLKWICGFANTQGGKIYIGKNDSGKVVGIDKAKKLMDDLPNKIVTNLGIICDTNLLEEDGNQFIEIIVESYPNPVNYKGQYHKLTVKHPSLPYNPKISNALFRSGYIEAWGRGTINMINECVQRHLPLPSYNVDYSGFIVKFINNTIIKSDGINDGLSDGVNRIVNDGVSDGVKKELITIIKQLESNEGINTDEIVKKLGGKSKPTVERYLKIARGLYMLEFKGASKTGGYYLTEKILRLLR